MRIVFNKIINAFLALYGVASLVFFLFTVLPGDSAQMMLGQNEDQELIEVLNKKFGSGIIANGSVRLKNKKAFDNKRYYLSPRYTTQWDELPHVKWFK